VEPREAELLELFELVELALLRVEAVRPSAAQATSPAIQNTAAARAAARVIVTLVVFVCRFMIDSSRAAG